MRNSTSLRTVFAPALIAATTAVAAVALVASPASADISLKGKRVQLIVASGAGGGTDRIGRLISQYMKKFLPGHPTIVVKNMGTGGGKIRAANYLMNKVKGDGLTFMQSDNTVLQPSTLRRKSARYDPQKFHFLGSVNRGGSVLFMRKDAKKRLMNKSAKPVIVAAISGTRSWQAMPMWGAEFLGWNLRWIPGYNGSGQMNKAIRQGEIDAFATNNAYLIDTLVKDGVVELLTQDGQQMGGKLVRRPSYKSIATMTENLKKKGISKEAWQGYQSMTGSSGVDKWMAMAPSTPKAYVKLYRAAYKSSVTDPAFLKIARKQFSKELFYIPGEEVAAMVNVIHSAPESALDYADSLKVKYGLASFRSKIYIRKGKISKIKKGGKQVYWKAKGNKGKLKVGKKTKISVAGNKAKRKALKVGMKCTFKVKGMKKALKIDCK
jgi:tripartite-type tricarboxylate transporter receptor subunit TctC